MKNVRAASMSMNTDVKKRFDAYPNEAKPKVKKLRKLILQAAVEYEVGPVEETLKWGEPSYLCKGGSTVRIGWKPEFPDKGFVFFHCQTKLVETIREIYGNIFHYENNRAVIASIGKDCPVRELKHCIYLSLQYHKLKHLPLLGAPNSR